MSAELIGILGVRVAMLSVGAALGALILAGRRDTAQQLAGMDRRLARVEARSQVAAACERLWSAASSPHGEWLTASPNDVRIGDDRYARASDGRDQHGSV